MPKSHTDSEYESQLKNLRERLLLMAGRVEDMIADSMKSLADHDPELARRTIVADHQVNRDEVETDELCLLILAKRQPMASDLRFITLALKMVTDLERIGDLAVNICERSIELVAYGEVLFHDDLAQMAEASRGMVRDAIDAFVERDDKKAVDVIRRDRTVDAFHAQISKSLFGLMANNAENFHRITRVQAIAKYLERIGDHATNLAEMVVFMVKGKDIRHLGSVLGQDAGYRPHGVLFLCVQNSARSQIAEGWARKLLPTSVRVWSAGSDPASVVNPHAVTVMSEVGVDISTQVPKRISDVPLGDIDTIITLCAEEVCVAMPGQIANEEWTYEDPAAAGDTDEARLEAFRVVRDDLKQRIPGLA